MRLHRCSILLAVSLLAAASAGPDPARAEEVALMVAPSPPAAPSLTLAVEPVAQLDVLQLATFENAEFNVQQVAASARFAAEAVESGVGWRSTQLESAKAACSFDALNPPLILNRGTQLGATTSAIRSGAARSRSAVRSADLANVT